MVVSRHFQHIGPAVSATGNRVRGLVHATRKNVRSSIEIRTRPGIFPRLCRSGRDYCTNREWLLVTESGEFMTARTDFPQMVRIEIDLIPGAALFKFPGVDPVLALPTMYATPMKTAVWKDGTFEAYHGDAEGRCLVRQALATPCKLLWLGRKSARPQKNNALAPMSFADGYPYLLLNQASLDDLNQQLVQPVDLRNFRPNLVIAGAGSYEEDDWKRIRIGAVEFEVAKPCTRCILTTVDPDQGVKARAVNRLKPWRAHASGLRGFALALIWWRATRGFFRKGIRSNYWSHTTNFNR